MVSLLNTTDMLGGGGATTTRTTTTSPTSVVLSGNVDVEEKKEDDEHATMTSAMTGKQQQKRSKYDKEQDEERLCNDQHDNDHDDNDKQKPSNEYVLNVAFFSFVGFLSVQAIFALIANSQAMLADCEAMAVDALTYLFNLCAERIKNRPYSQYELSLPPAQRRYLRELRRLYLELVPPALSVATLIGVTIVTLREAFGTLLGIEENGDGDADEDVSVTIMLLFSGANLLLDVVNVTCFARADNAFSLDVVRRENAGIREGIRESMMAGKVVVEKGGEHHHHHHQQHPNEKTRLLLDDVVVRGEQEQQPPEHEHMVSSSALVPEHPHALINLNMCSAWTHVCADTLRSTAVLVAAFIAMFIVPWVPGETADAVAAVVVSVIILGSLLPLLQGLALTAVEIYMLHQNNNNNNTRRRRQTRQEQQHEQQATVVVQV